MMPGPEFPWSKSISLAKYFSKIRTVRESALIADFRYGQFGALQHFLCFVEPVGDQVFYGALVQAFAKAAHRLPLTYPYGIRNLRYCDFILIMAMDIRKHISDSVRRFKP